MVLCSWGRAMGYLYVSRTGRAEEETTCDVCPTTAPKQDGHRTAAAKLCEQGELGVSFCPGPASQGQPMRGGCPRCAAKSLENAVAPDFGHAPGQSQADRISERCEKRRLIGPVESRAQV